MTRRLFYLVGFSLVLVGVLVMRGGGGTAVAAPNAVIFSESMYDGTGGSSGDSIAVHESNNRFANDGLTMSGTGDMRTTLPSADYSGTSGTWNVMLNASSEYFQIADVNTSDYTNLSLSFGVRKNTNAENGSGLTVAVSTDGTNWTNLTFSALPTGTGTAAWYYRTASGAIPVTANLRIRFTSSNTVEWRIDDVLLEGDLGGGGDTPPTVSSTSPANGASNVPLASAITINFSEPVGATATAFAVACPTGTPVTFSSVPVLPGSGSSFVLTSAGLPLNTTCTVTVTATEITDQDGDPDNMAANYSFSFTTTAVDVCSLSYTPIYNIQGSGLSAAITGVVTTQGVVVGDFEGTSPTMRGFYLQDLTGDGNVLTSDGIFVFNGDNNSVSLGDVVRVTGTAGEYETQTQISSVTSIAPCGAGSVEPVEITLPFASAEYLERYEGMLVRLPQTLYVTENFRLGRFGQVTLTSRPDRLQQPTNVALPGGPALTLQAANNLDRIIVDDALNNQNPDPIIFGRGGLPLSAANTLRGGDSASGIVGVLTYTWGGNAASPNAYRVRPIGALNGGIIDFQPANLRQTNPQDVGGIVQVASFNVLNYFNNFTGCTAGVGGATTDCRGANNTAEFTRQRNKIIHAIVVIDAAVVGLMEIENDGYGVNSAIADLVNGLNAAAGAGTYAYVNADARTGATNILGTDAIKVGLLYQPGKVSLAGTTAVLKSSTAPSGTTFLDNKNRPVLIQSFQHISTGEIFTVAVNHLKSKGSACTDVGDPDLVDGQGNCNVTRRNAAQALVTYLENNPTGVGSGYNLIIGDLNAYAMEDPISAIKNAGYTDLVNLFGGNNAYGYQFDGQWGYLDHALASNALLPFVTGTVEWHINADEPIVLDYNTEFKSAGQIVSLYNDSPFRSSDHDPVLVGLFAYNISGAPASYGYAWHSGDGDILRLGDEWLVQRTPTINSGDGVVRTPGVAWTPGTNKGSVDVMATGEACASVDCYLNAWVDWDNSGDFSAGEQIFANRAVREGKATLTFAVPAAPDCFTNQPCYARFRLTETADDGTRAPVGPTGRASTGEVEDYTWGFTPTAVSLQSLSTHPTNPTWLPFLATGLMALGLTGLALRRRKG
jgi:uncharacterized protein